MNLRGEVMAVTRMLASEFMKLPTKQKTIIDLRTAAEVANESVAGCIALPIQALTPERCQSALAEHGHTNEPVYLLCQSGVRAEMAVDKLSSKLTHDLVIIEGGLNQLKMSGLTTIQGKSQVISLERQVRIAAGALTVTGGILGSLVHPYFYGISAFVGAGLMFAGITNSCGMAMLLARMPWNQ